MTLVTLFVTMILDYSSVEPEKIWNGEFSKKLPANIQEVERRKLRMLNNAQEIADLKIPPANRLEKLSGRLKDCHSIRINDKWRIIFKWSAGNASSVSIVDYH